MGLGRMRLPVTTYAMCLAATLGLAIPASARTYPESTVHSFNPAPFGVLPTAPLIQAVDGNLYGTTTEGGAESQGAVFKITNFTTSPSFSVIYSFKGGTDGARPNAIFQASDGNLYGMTNQGGSSGFGTVFKISDLTTTPTESVIYTFTGGPDGAGPTSLVQASDGNVFGIGAGGSSGAVFKISNLTTTPTESVIYTFTGGLDGAGPTSLIQASDGNLYGATTAGGPTISGTVFKISNPATSPAFSVIYTFAGNTGFNAHFSLDPTLMQASDGNLYGTTATDGSTFSGTVFKISNLTTSPTFAVIYNFMSGDFMGGGDAGYPESPLIQFSDGNLYGTGTLGQGTVFRISNLSGVPKENVVYTFAGASDGANPAASLLEAADGNLYGTTYQGGLTYTGTVFRIANPTNLPTESVIYSFITSDGSDPQSLIQASDGNLYGTTIGGGSSNAGTVFKISNLRTVPTETVIYSFTGGTDGGYPSSLIQASDGNLYGMTSVGGSDGTGTVFRISNLATSPTESVIYSFRGGSDGGAPEGALIQASNGTLYGTTLYGGSANMGTVFKISDLSTSPAESVVHSFGEGLDGAYPNSLIQARDGNLYGTTPQGGPLGCIATGVGCGVVFRISDITTSPTESVIYEFAGGSDGANPSPSLIQASDSSLYGMTTNGGSGGCRTFQLNIIGCGTVFSISNLTTSPTETVIYSFAGGSDGANPDSMIQTSEGDFYGTTSSGGSSDTGTVFRISNPTAALTESVAYSFAGGNDGGDPDSLIQATDGKLYGTTATAGTAGAGVVFSIDPDLKRPPVRLAPVSPPRPTPIRSSRRSLQPSP